MPARLQDYVITPDDIPSDEDIVNFTLFTSCDLVVYENAASDDWWMQVMEEENHSIEKNETWELTSLPIGKKAIGVKWVYKTKFKLSEEVDKYKVKLVVKEYKQKPGIDYFEVFAPIVRLDTICMIISLTAQNNWRIYQIDIKSGFLNGVLNEDMYVEQLVGFVRRSQENKVYRLKRALYGLKQAPRPWYTRIDSYFLTRDF